MELLKRLLAARGKASSASVAPAEAARLGVELLAVHMGSGDEVPAECTAVVVAESGHTRRVGAFGSPRVHFGAAEVAWCFHPGPYALAVLPFASAGEAGLRVEFVIDAGDPRQQQQRFDLYLASELSGGEGPLTVVRFAGAVQLALQNALSEGMLDLPPCTSIDEWHAFRAGLNELLYTRFGVTVEDCYPVDLHPGADLAAALRARRRPAAAASPSAPVARPAAATAAFSQPVVPGAPPPPPSGSASPPRPAGTSAEPPQRAAAFSAPSGHPGAPRAPASMDTSHAAAPAPAVAAASPGSGGTVAAAADDAADAHALRRLFLELPALSAALRMITPPANAFTTQQELLQRLALAALDVNTMPALQLASPDRKLAAAVQARRAAHAREAAAALDNAWSLLARLKLAHEDDIAQLFDEADRLIANLEFALAERRNVPPRDADAPGSAAGGAPGEASARARREPTMGPPK